MTIEYNEYGEAPAHGFPILRRTPLPQIKIIVPICKDGYNTGETEEIICNSVAEAAFYRWSREQLAWRTKVYG